MGNDALRCRRGTVSIGAIAIIAVFMIAVSCFALLIVEYDRYLYVVKVSTQKLLLRGRENLSVERLETSKLKVINKGSVTSFVVGIFVRSGSDIQYIPLDTPINVKILSEREIVLPDGITEEMDVSVITAYGNVFWAAESA